MTPCSRVSESTARNDTRPEAREARRRGRRAQQGEDGDEIHRNTIHPDAQEEAFPIPKPRNTHAAADIRAVAELRLALRRFEQSSDRAVRRCGLTPRQHLLLLALEGRHDGSASVGALSDELLLAQSTVTELVDRSQERGLVERAVSDDDARVVLVRTTAHGRAVLARAMVALGDQRDQLVAAIGGRAGSSTGAAASNLRRAGSTAR